MENITGTKTIEEYLSDPIKSGTIVYPEIESLRYLIAEQKKEIEELKKHKLSCDYKHNDYESLEEEILLLQDSLKHACIARDENEYLRQHEAAELNKLKFEIIEMTKMALDFQKRYAGAMDEICKLLKEKKNRIYDSTL